LHWKLLLCQFQSLIFVFVFPTQVCFASELLGIVLANVIRLVI
jgi:hypothetical protein